jgi:hypothetical protein
VIVGAVGHHLVAALLENRDHGAGVGDHAPLIVLEFRLQRFKKGHGLGGDDVHQRAALDAGEHQRAELLLQLRVALAQDQAAARAAQGFVGSGGDDVGERHRVRV